MKSLNRNLYVAARIDDATRETKLYFQTKKSQTIDSYKLNEAYIKAQSGNCIKVICSDRGGEFQAQALINHQNQLENSRSMTYPHKTELLREECEQEWRELELSY